jgi:zinc transport system permease protein
MRATLALSVAVGLGSAIAGLSISYYANLPPGGTIVLVAAAVYLVALGTTATHRR